MPEAGRLIAWYVEATQAAETTADFLTLTRAAISYVNKVHMWFGALFP